jgi:RimJ/RimL family protein N-acetyltransferase
MACIKPRIIRATTGDAVAIRSARPDDAAALLAYFLSVSMNTPFLVTEADERSLTEEQERQWIQDHLGGPGKLAVVAEASGTVVGFLDFENGSRRRIAHRGSFGMLVKEGWRGKGIGTALIDALIDWAQENPLIEKIGLAVFAENERAIRLYRKLGFQEEGHRVREVKLGPGRYSDDILMYRLVK